MQSSKQLQASLASHISKLKKQKELLPEIVENTNDLECVVVTGIRKDKNDKEKLYTTVSQLLVV